MTQDQLELETAWNADVIALVRSGKEMSVAIVLADECMVARLERFPRADQRMTETFQSREMLGYDILCRTHFFPNTEGARIHYRSALKLAAETGQKINAIKAIRAATGIGLKEAKDHLETHILPVIGARP